MAAPNPLSGLDTDFTDLDWKESVGNFHPGGGETFAARGGGDAPLVGYIDYKKRIGFHRFVLGYCAVADGGLSRTNPVRNPDYQKLVAVGSSAIGMKPRSRNRRDTLTGQPIPGTTELKQYIAGAPLVPTFSGVAQYDKAKVSIHFTAPPWACIEDPNVSLYTRSGYGADGAVWRAEWQRNTELELAPGVQQVNLSGFVLYYAEGQSNTAPTTNPYTAASGSPASFPSELSQLVGVSDVVIRTHMLPENFLFRSGEAIPRAVARSLGRVNRYAFYNGKFPVGTLLHTATKLTRERWGLQLGTESEYLYTAEHHFSYTNQAKGYSSNAILTSEAGWNNVPWRGGINVTTGAPVSGDLNAGKWFLATRSGSSSDARLYEYFDFHQLWLAAEKPIQEPSTTPQSAGVFTP